jgi:hypothetical protein
LTTGLKAEIKAAIEWTNYQEQSLDQTLKALAAARAKGAVVKNARIQPGSMTVTDATVYRQIASELGRLPPALIQSVVRFYANALRISRIADGAPTVEDSCKVVLETAPRLKMYAAMLLLTLDKFEASGFSSDADIEPKPEEVRKLAVDTGYPLEQIMRERGIQP